MHTTTPGASAPDLTHTIAFLAAQLADSQRQIEKEDARGKAFCQGRTTAFALAIDMLRGVTQ
jgi:hypothetical protein